MLQSFYFLLLISTSSVFAATPMLEKYKSSGYMSPVRLIQDCDILSNGDASIAVNRNGETSGYTKRVNRSTMLYIEALLEVAARGKIEEEAVGCDTGNIIVRGSLRGKKIVIDEATDCLSHWVNKSRGTGELKRLAKRICGF